MAEIEEILQEFSGEQKDLIHILHRIQERFGYISPAAVAKISARLKISPNEIFGVLTFYKAFSLEPRGQHLVTVCLGTACHVRGGVQIVEEIERKLGIKAGRTTPDGKYTLETVNCLGCCAIGPVVVVDGQYHSHVNLKKVESILNEGRSSQ
ncbi:MAG: NADH-quinone oxidoreductase subunit NuoE [Candidatus Aminicenantales bacterium]